MRTTDDKNQEPAGFQQPLHADKGSIGVGQMLQKMRGDNDVLTALWQIQACQISDDHPGETRPKPRLGGQQHGRRPVKQA